LPFGIITCCAGKGEPLLHFTPTDTQLTALIVIREVLVVAAPKLDVKRAVVVGTKHCG
jgi:hypothetical protein